jgi:hypothetical protein
VKIQDNLQKFKSQNLYHKDCPLENALRSLEESEHGAPSTVTHATAAKTRAPVGSQASQRSILV